MAYQRRHSAQSRTSRSEEDAHLTSPVGSAGLAPLSPPRPFFISSHNSGERGSYSSADTSQEGSDSDRDREPAPQQQPPPVPTKQRNHHRRRSQMANQYGAVEADVASPRDPFVAHQPEPETWTPTALYEESRQRTARAPPSSFAFPFQAYPGNPDPGMSIPGVSRRSSVDSIRRPNSAGPEGTTYPSSHGHSAVGGYGGLPMHSPSATDLTHETDLGRPYAPFMGPGSGDGHSAHSRRSSVSLTPPDVYRASAAGALQQGSPSLGGHPDLPRSSSVGTFRAPFLSPASRPSSSFWTPPGVYNGAASPRSGSALALSVQKHRPPMPSTRIAAKLTAEEKPWIRERDGMGRLSWWITIVMLLVGTGVGAVLCWQGYEAVYLLDDSQLCQVLFDDFSDGALNTDIWQKEIQMGGFGNGEFEAMTGEDKNLYLKNSELYIMPTLTSDDYPDGGVFDGTDWTIDGCTTADSNATACSASSSNSSGTVLPPVKSARINTAASTTIAFGKVEVRAKLPRGDWLWPAIWMLPANYEDTSLPRYGAWPLSGEIDIMEARGNGPTYAAQGNNVVRSSLNYGPLPGTQARLFGWQSFKRQSLADGFHTYTLEWTREWMRMYIDSRLQAMLTFNNKHKSFFDRGGFPKTAKNGSDTDVVISDIWAAGDVPNMAPFDQQFYLIINLAAGGTSGWFPDGVGGKPWYDGSGSAMRDFALNQSTWAATWPSSENDRAFRIDYVKMWKLKDGGSC